MRWQLATVVQSSIVDGSVLHQLLPLLAYWVLGPSGEMRGVFEPSDDVFGNFKVDWNSTKIDEYESYIDFPLVSPGQFRSSHFSSHPCILGLSRSNLRFPTLTHYERDLGHSDDKFNPQAAVSETTRVAKTPVKEDCSTTDQIDETTRERGLPFKGGYIDDIVTGSIIVFPQQFKGVSSPPSRRDMHGDTCLASRLGDKTLHTADSTGLESAQKHEFVTPVRMSDGKLLHRFRLVSNAAPGGEKVDPVRSRSRGGERFGVFTATASDNLGSYLSGNQMMQSPSPSKNYKKHEMQGAILGSTVPLSPFDTGRPFEK
ncbi:hypothetical protein BV22DRAFT_1044652 [Leucogyrophana mollusca]|uniref:Uncharacterized protein n=1 Tax=Leucogyrophana mollusca TaxID=85980 RepID=A0ACB8BR40_9AGAM|nr:hypothetical protein BV22DRAFT_1044652 [Leucogyrophana mollusca]